MSRLFTFGCSFTRYHWPTWADILACNFDYFANWGQVGAGNQFITTSLVECNLKHHLTEHDTVGIMWSNVSRLDTYKKRQWHTPGNIYTQNVYSKEIVESLFDTRGFYIRDLAAMYLAHQLLEKIGCRYFMFSMVDIRNHLQYEHNDACSHISDVLAYYAYTLTQIKPSIHSVVFNNDWLSRPFMMEKQMSVLKAHYENVSGKDWPQFMDVLDPATIKKLDKKIIKEIFNLNKWDWKKLLYSHRRNNIHPTPLEHLEYLSKVMPEELISSETYETVKQMDLLVQNGTEIDSLLTNFTKSEIIERW